jgi:hypothetical protein
MPLTLPPTILTSQEDGSSTYIYAFTTDKSGIRYKEITTNWSIAQENDIDGVYGHPSGDAFILQAQTPQLMPLRQRVLAVVVARYTRAGDTVWDMDPRAHEGLARLTLVQHREYAALLDTPECKIGLVARLMKECKEAAYLVGDTCAHHWSAAWQLAVPPGADLPVEDLLKNRTSVSMALLMASGVKEEKCDPRNNIQFWMEFNHGDKGEAEFKWAGLEVKQSDNPNAGMGLFTTTDRSSQIQADNTINPKNKVICAFSGHWITAESAQIKTPKGLYVFKLNNGWPQKAQELLRYRVYSGSQAHYINSATYINSDGVKSVGLAHVHMRGIEMSHTHTHTHTHTYTHTHITFHRAMPAKTTCSSSVPRVLNPQRGISTRLRLSTSSLWSPRGI